MNSSSIMPIAKRPDIVMTHGKGSYLYDEQGREYLDFVQGWAVNALGHSPKIIQETLYQQANVLINPSPAFYNRPMIDLADFLVANSCFDQVFFANSGAEANEGAIKLARKWGQKFKNGAYEIITFQSGFHGRTLTTMSASGKPEWQGLFEPKTSGFCKAVYNDIDSVEANITEQTVAIMLELIQGEGGVISARPDFVVGLERIAKKHNLLLIVDEVQTGMARTGSRFAYEKYSIQPDIMTLGKGLGGGVPISALLSTRAVSCFDFGDQGGTFNGNPLMCAVALAVSKTVFEPKFLIHVQEHSHYLKSQLAQLSTEFSLGSVRGEGLLIGLNLNHRIAAHQVAESARDSGLLINAPKPDILRFMPALNLTNEETDKMIDILSQIFVTRIDSSTASF